MGVWSSLSSLAADGMEEVEGLFSSGGAIAADDPGLAAGLSSDDISQIDAMSAAPAAKGKSAGGDDAWVEDALKGVMGQLMRPTPQPRSSPIAPGHAINANAATVMKPFDEVQKMANDNPLDSLNKWAGMFG
ncbi:Uncharacterised protein [Serratia quinivorans]|uniref:hypothetical protein n=1 Tax=Serratia quinivorans TaxID=137545 RepID=UPI00217991E3|nr:hypothetical protein [Serratia quinivorans]CAI1768784.1 Uncharacterised protein [Serratia quinivorans]